MSSAKQAVGSTIKRVLIHMAEIIASIILLVIISVPLIFVIPMWFQETAFGTAIANFAVNPVTWFGLLGAVGVTILLAIVSLVFGYGYVLGMSARLKAKEAKKSSAIEEEAEEPAEVAEVVAEAEEPVEDASTDSEEASE